MRNRKNIFENYMGLVVLIILGIIFILIISYQKQEAKESPFSVVNADVRKTINYQDVLNNIEAKSFYVYDISDKKMLFSKDEHFKLPLASITKLMSALVAKDIMPETTIVTIGKSDVAMEGDSGLIVGEKWRLDDLLDFSLITSSNDGMHAVASALNSYEIINNKNIIDIMNERARTLGLNDTIFVNETGLDVDENMSGAYSSAYDVSLLFEDIIKNNPSLIYNTNKYKMQFVSESKIKHLAINTNTAINQISDIISSKTGFTNLAGGNLAIIFDAGFMHPVIIVVLGSSEEGRFSDVMKLATISLAKLSE